MNDRSVQAGCFLGIGYNFSEAFWVGYTALFGIAVETGVVIVIYLHESTIHVLILVTVFFAVIKERALRRGKLGSGPSHADFTESRT